MSRVRRAGCLDQESLDQVLHTREQHRMSLPADVLVVRPVLEFGIGVFAFNRAREVLIEDVMQDVQRPADLAVALAVVAVALAVALARELLDRRLLLPPRSRARRPAALGGGGEVEVLEQRNTIPLSLAVAAVDGILLALAKNNSGE